MQEEKLKKAVNAMSDTELRETVNRVASSMGLRKTRIDLITGDMDRVRKLLSQLSEKDLEKIEKQFSLTLDREKERKADGK